METFFFWAGVASFLWLGSGLVYFVVASIAQWWNGLRTDGEWVMGLAICVGAGPIIIWMALMTGIEEVGHWRRRKREAKKCTQYTRG